MPKETEIAEGLHVVKLMRKGNNSAATIPAEICEKIGAQPGRDRLLMRAIDKGVVIFKADSIEADAAIREFDYKSQGVLSHLRFTCEATKERGI